MELQLKYKEKTNLSISAAYLTGEVNEWFTEIASWSIDPLSLAVYFIPKNISDRNSGGIFVVFKGEIPQRNKIRQPFGQIATNFFIPVNASLFPKVTASEIDGLKLWDIQFFHPYIGLVGFEHHDVRELVELIEFSANKRHEWIQDLPLASVSPQLRAVFLQPSESLDAVAELKSEMNLKPLGEIPDIDDEKNGLFSKKGKLLKPLINIGLWILLLFAFFGKFLLEIIAFFLPKVSTPVGNGGRSSLLNTLNSWIDKQMASIEKQRDTELNRLVKLFEKDKDMALQYAIPLGSAHLNRGVAKPSSKLSRRNLNINFRNFNSGGAVDYWDLGNYSWVLQQQYEKAATEAIENGDYKKAAYIYAHLLGDLSRAAITLENGKHYREAAAIYTNHLQNNIRAAECLERGGLLNEAIALYVTSESYEKAGDLYLQIGQEVKAIKYFEETINKSLNARDNLNASRIIELKLADLERSQQVLLEGWVHDNKPEQCLTKYFELAKKRELSIPGVVQDIFTSHVTRNSGTSFLGVLADLVATTDDNILKEQAQSICYQIVHQQIGYGDFSALKIMNLFVPEDQMLVQDAHRYAMINYVKFRQLKANEFIQLDADVTWTDFCIFHDQLIGVGMKGKDVLMLRMNWDDRKEYSYLFHTKEGSRYKLTADSWISSDILIVSHEILSNDKFFPANQFFQREFDLYQLSWVSRDAIGHAVNKNGNLTCLEVANGEEIVLKTYTYTGELLSSFNCIYGTEKIKIHELNFRTSKMYWRKEHLYFVGKDMVARINETGILDLLIIEHEVLSFSLTGLHAALKIALLTVEGCLIVLPTLKEMKIAIPLFGGSLNAHLIQLLPDNHLVLASSEKAQVYDISENKLNLLFEIFPDHSIIGILSVPKRNHFALVDANNRISTYIIAKEE